MDEYLGSIMIFSFGITPKYFALCNGQLLPINQNQALFSLLGTTYGGNGQTTFALPNFIGKTPIHVGNGFTQGQTGGQESHTLNITEIPQHNHTLGSGDVKAKTGATNANKLTPEGNYYATNPALTGRFSNQTDTGMYNNAPFNTGTIGAGQSHENRMPFLVLNYCICLVGIFPSRN